MRVIAIMSSGNSNKFGAIIEHFKNTPDIKIVCISDNLRSDIFTLTKPEFVETKYLSPEAAQSYFMNNTFDLIAINGYQSKLDTGIYSLGKFINLHQSLLPAFKGDNALYRAFESGVKVSGITIHTLTGNNDTEKILAQYPILISALTHFDEFEKMTNTLTDLLYPIVIEKTLQNKLFDFQDLYDKHKSCSGNCSGGCGGCH